MAQKGGSVTKTAIITGGAGGLGLALDAELRAKSWRVMLIDLPGSALDAVEASTDRMVFGCDLTDTTKMKAVCDEIRAQCASIDLVIYNAGVTHIGAFESTAIPSHRNVFEINYFAAVSMAKELLEDVRKSKGVHLAVSSVAGFSPLFNRTAYSASKHAMEGFFKSLRSEEKQHGVDCLIAAPSFVATNLGEPQTRSDGTSRPGAAADGVDYMSPKSAAEIIVRGLERRSRFIPVGRIARLSYWINRLSPNLLQRLMERKFSS